MKKLIIVLVFFAIILPVFAQNNAGSGEKAMYYHNVTIEKIYLSIEGYIVQYRKGVNEIGTIGIPYEWFTGAASKAEVLLLPYGIDWPSMSVFYEDGEFKFVRLYVHRWKRHRTWSVVPQGADVSRHFKDSDSLKIDF